MAGYQYEVNPERCDPTKFNLFTGKLPMSHLELPIEGLTEVELAYLKPVTDHLLPHFCEVNAVLSDYLLSWLAIPLERLSIKTGVATVVNGLPGTAFI